MFPLGSSASGVVLGLGLRERRPLATNSIRPFGSVTTLAQFAVRFNANAVRKIMSPGMATIHQAVDMYERPSPNIDPHEGMGG